MTTTTFEAGASTGEVETTVPSTIAESDTTVPSTIAESVLGDMTMTDGDLAMMIAEIGTEMELEDETVRGTETGTRETPDVGAREIGHPDLGLRW